MRSLTLEPRPVQLFYTFAVCPANILEVFESNGCFQIHIGKVCDLSRGVFKMNENMIIIFIGDIHHS